MSDLQLFDDQKMTVKEIAEILKCSIDTVQYTIKKIFPELIKQGKTTRLSEALVTVIKLELDKSQNFRNVAEVPQTKLERVLIIKQAMDIMLEDLQTLQEENTGLKHKVIEMQPATDFYKSVTDSKDAIEMSKVAKVLDMGIGRNKLFNRLRDLKILRFNNEPYQEYIDRGYFRVVEQKFTTSLGETRISIKTLVYQKGLEYIRKMLIRS